MESELNKHLRKVHEFEKTDFRWSNLRKIVKRLIVGKKVLDAGCGTGHLSLDLLRDGYDVTSVDYSDELVRFAQKTIGDAGYRDPADIFRCDLVSLKDHNLQPFDTIVCLDVIEHIEQDDIVLKNLWGLLKPDGVLILSVPAIGRLYGRRDETVGHLRRYDRKELIAKLDHAGFVPSTVRYWNFAGLVPVLLSEKVFRHPVNETARYSRDSLFSKMINPVLNGWFLLVENNIPFPLGLTLIAVCRKK